MAIEGIGRKSDSFAPAVEDAPPTPTAAKREEPAGQSVEQHVRHAWDAEPPPPVEARPSEAPVSLSELQASEAEKMKRRSDFREATLDSILHLAKLYPDGELKQSALAHGGFVDSLRGDKPRQLLGKMSEGDIQASLGLNVERSWKGLDSEAKRDVLDSLTRQVREHAKYDAAFRMRDEAVETMKSTARDLEALASAPKQLEKLAGELRHMPLAEQMEVRNKLGVDDPTPLNWLDAKEMAPRISARAKLLEKEAGELERSGANRVFLVMADHDVSAAFARKAGVEPGSIGWEQMRAAQAQGKSDQADLEHMKLACAVAASFATAGLGGAAALGSGAAGALVMNAPGVYEKFHAVDSARAGESAGTMKEGSVERAKHNRNVAAAALAVEVAAGGLAAHKLAHPVEHALEHAVTEATAEALAHGIGHATVTAGVIAGEHLASEEHD